MLLKAQAAALQMGGAEAGGTSGGSKRNVAAVRSAWVHVQRRLSNAQDTGFIFQHLSRSRKEHIRTVRGRRGRA